MSMVIDKGSIPFPGALYAAIPLGKGFTVPSFRRYFKVGGPEPEEAEKKQILMMHEANCDLLQ